MRMIIKVHRRLEEYQAPTDAGILAAFDAPFWRMMNEVTMKTHAYEGVLRNEAFDRTYPGRREEAKQVYAARLAEI